MRTIVQCPIQWIRLTWIDNVAFRADESLEAVAVVGAGAVSAMAVKAIRRGFRALVDVVEALRAFESGPLAFALVSINPIYAAPVVRAQIPNTIVHIPLALLSLEAFDA